MDFNGKTFVYKTMSFGDFAAQVQDGKRLYLRSLSADAPADQPASLEQDFPALGAEFVLPDELRICRENMHSSILRISGPVNMWLHFGESYASTYQWFLLLTLALQMSKPMCIVRSKGPSACSCFHHLT